MPLISETELKAQIKSGKMNSCYLFYGDESYLKQFYVNRICSSFVPAESETFSLRKYEGKDDSFEDVFEGANSISFMSDQTVVIAHDFPLDAPKAEDKETIETFLDNQPDTSITIFWMDAIDMFEKKSGNWAMDIFAKKATAVNFKKASLEELKKILSAYAGKQGCIMQERTAQYLIENAGDDLNTLFNEVNKAANYVGEGKEITKADIDSVVVKSLEANVFHLSNHILRKNPTAALELLHTLLMQKAEPVEILAVLIMHFSDIYRAKVAVDAGKKAEYLGDTFGYGKNPFRLTNGGKSGAKMTMGQLRECLDKLNEADKALKNSSQDGTLVLEKLIVSLSLILAR